MKLTILAALAAMALAAPALATEPAPPTFTIRYSDLDLDDARDAKTMLRRIRLAAVKVCPSGLGGFEALTRFEACYRDTLRRAVATLDAPRVTAAHNAKLGSRTFARLP